MSSKPIEVIPKRLKIYLTAVVVIFVFGYFSLVFIENMSFIDAFYFLVVTVTTVGFGDITPTTPISKIIVSLLIIISISSLALLSEQIINRLVSINTQQYLELPAKSLDYKSHIIICGYTKIAENIAMMFQVRFFRVIVLDPHMVAVQRARRNGLESYLASPQLKPTLEKVNIEQAEALYLFMDDENSNVLTSLQARNLAGPSLLIYASTEHELSIELGNLIGIDRTYHYERIVASNIEFALSDLSAFSLPNQLLSPRAKFEQVLVTKDFSLKDNFDVYYPIGMLDKTFTSFRPIEQIENVGAELEKGSLLMVSVPREIVEKTKTDKIRNTPIIEGARRIIDKVIIGGYNDTARHVIKEMDQRIINDYDFSILTFVKSEAERAESEGYKVIYAERPNLPRIFSEVCTNTTLLVNLFERLTDSLLVNTVKSKLERDIFTVQLAFDRIETDVLIKSGVDRILIPDVLMSRGMFLILLHTKKYLNSIIWSDAHILEHYVDQDSPLRQKRIRELQKLGYSPLLHRRKNGEVTEHVGDIFLNEGDNIILFREHNIMQEAEQLIDPTH